ncbi:MAG TPA: PadR family transcriptional regulator [Gaiellaceae bacterium]
MSSTDERQLTTTSYAILGLLAIRPWSTYELTKQMRRSLHHIWPRAESNVYAEPKRLVEAGLATTEVQRVGKRTRTLYTITGTGLGALRSWLGTESGPSRFESELAVKVLFGNEGKKEELLTNLRRFAEEAAAVKEFWKAIAAEYVSGTHAFPERVHVNALIFRLVGEQAKTNARWAEWAIEEVESWPDVAAPTDAEGALETFRTVLPS